MTLLRRRSGKYARHQGLLALARQAARRCDQGQPAPKPLICRQARGLNSCCCPDFRQAFVRAAAHGHAAEASQDPGAAGEFAAGAPAQQADSGTASEPISRSQPANYASPSAIRRRKDRRIHGLSGQYGAASEPEGGLRTPGRGTIGRQLGAIALSLRSPGVYRVLQRIHGVSK